MSSKLRDTWYFIVSCIGVTYVRVSLVHFYAEAV